MRYMGVRSSKSCDERMSRLSHLLVSVELESRHREQRLHPFKYTNHWYNILTASFQEHTCRFSLEYGHR